MRFYRRVYEKRIYIKGGNISFTASKYEPLVCNGMITVANDYYIQTPKGGQIFKNNYQSYIVDKDQNVAKEVVFAPRKDLADATITGIEDKEYTGSEITQNPVLKIDGETLTEGVDYTVEYEDNKEVGTATVSFKATKSGCCKGSTSTTFNIKAKEEKKDSKSDDKGDDKKDDGKSDKPKYSNEWVDGKWYDEFGNGTYSGTLQWKNNATGWWVEDTEGWYPTNQWQKIDGVWYFFKPDGYMASEEYYGGYWYYFNSSGYMVTSQYVDGWWIDADGVCR